MVESIVFHQLLMFLHKDGAAEVANVCRGVALVRTEGSDKWIMVCSTPDSITHSVVLCKEDPLVLC